MRIKTKMASRVVEDKHKEVINKLLEESGLVCVKPFEEVEEEHIPLEDTEEESEHELEIELEPESTAHEEPKAETTQISDSDLYRVFPSPSLRKVLPEKIREFEKQDRIHVLPEEFRKDIDPLAIPKIATTPHQVYIDAIAEIVGCEEYKNNLAEYWFLDTLANLLRRAQEDDLRRNAQAVLILWFCEWMKEIQYFDAADRERMLKRFKDNMLAAARHVGMSAELPTPDQVGVHYKARDEDDEKADSPTTSIKKSGVKPSKDTSPRSEKRISFETESKYECALSDLLQIIHYIYDLFSTDYLFDLVRSIFTFTPDYVNIDYPHKIQNPKRLYVPSKGKVAKKEKTPRKEKPAGKDSKKGKAGQVPDTAEYIALMELKQREEKELEEMEEMAREEWNMRSHILPLSMAADEEFFNLYWPPPTPPPEPAIEEPPPPPQKGKKGKK